MDEPSETTEPTHPPDSADLPPRHVNPARLRRLLAGRFDAGELRTLCFDLQIDYDDLPGAGKANKARDLVAYLERRKGLNQLIEVGRRLRPDVPWDQAFDLYPDTALGRLRAGVGARRGRWLYAGLAALALVSVTFLAWQILSTGDRGTRETQETAAPTPLPSPAADAVALSLASTRLEGANVRDILAGGDVWVVADQTGISRFDFDSYEWRDYGTLEGRVAEPEALARDAGGRVWIGDLGRGLTVLTSDGQIEMTRTVGAANGVTAVALDENGAAWVGAWDTVHRRDVRGDWAVITPPVESAYAIQEIAPDPGGHLWFALYGAGVARLDLVDSETSGWTIINRENSCVTSVDCLLSDFVNTLYVDAQGRKWIGTEEGLSVLDDRGATRRWHNFTAADGLPAPDVRAIVADDAGRFYVGTTAGLALLVGLEGRPRLLSPPRGIAAPAREGSISALAFEPASRTLWVGTVKEGLSVWLVKE